MLKGTQFNLDPPTQYVEINVLPRGDGERVWLRGAEHEEAARAVGQNGQ